MRLLLLVLLPAVLQGQGFATLEGNVIATKGNLTPSWGINFTAGGFPKSKSQNNFMLGAGVSFNYFDDVYIAPYLVMGFFNRKAKISPYANAHVGYGFYSAGGSFAGVHSNKGGLFTDVRAGAGFKVTRLLRITPYVGIQGLMLRYVVRTEVKESHFAGLVHGGVALVFTR